MILDKCIHQTASVLFGLLDQTLINTYACINNSLSINFPQESAILSISCK